jgi:hypothetical protein
VFTKVLYLKCNWSQMFYIENVLLTFENICQAKCLEIIEGVDHNAFHALDHIIRPVSTFLQVSKAYRQTHTHTHTQTDTHTHTHTHMYACMRVCMHACMYIYIRICKDTRNVNK